MQRAVFFLHLRAGSITDNNSFGHNFDLIAATDTEKYYSNYFRDEFGQTLVFPVGALFGNQSGHSL